MATAVTVPFSLAELRYLLSLAQANQDKGVYSGNREQFYARQERVIEKLEKAVRAYE